MATRDLERRVNGEFLPETHQRITEAVLNHEKVENPKRGKLSKIWKPSKSVVEDEHAQTSLRDQ